MIKKIFGLTILLLFSFSVVNASEYIYLDLYYGNISITTTQYTGYNLSGEAVSGTHTEENQYYICQSKGDSTPRDEAGLPDYSRVMYDDTTTWGDYITNHPAKSTYTDKADSVDEVITAWGNLTKANSTSVNANGIAVKAGRVPTTYYIKINGSGTYNVIIDDIWSSNQVKAAANTANLGGITFIPTAINTTLNLSIEGDNRFGNIFAATKDGTNGNYTLDVNHTNTMTIKEYNEGSNATLTVCNLMVNSDYTNTASCIGGTDAHDHSVKMFFESGIIYAGSGKDDFATAIGGGGNGVGNIIINGGKITAIHSSTGTAIGGGCGTSGPGGYGNVTINGGEVYAYSYKVAHKTYSTYTGSLPAAIGGGSSGIQIGGTGIVNITGGKVYAYSEMGNAIGGGGGGIGYHSSNYYSATGGIADVTISGGEITAVSDHGCAIGGGPGGGSSYSKYSNVSATNLPPDILTEKATKVSANGGEATLTILDGIINTGSIGGGSPLFKTGTEENAYGFLIGAAKVYILGGTLHGQIVMEGEGSICEMSEGLIDNSNIGAEYKFVKNRGGAIYIKTGDATLTGGTIQNASAEQGGAIYIANGKATIKGGTIKNATATEGGAVYINGGDFELLENGNITDCNATSGGAVYIALGTTNITGGTIENCEATANGRSNMRNWWKRSSIRKW